MVERHLSQDIFMYLGFCLMTITFCKWFYDIYIQQAVIDKSAKRLATLSLAMGFSYCFYLAAVGTIVIKYGVLYDDNVYISQAGLIFAIYQRVFLYLFYLYRIHQTFENTSLQLPKLYKFSKIIILIIFTIFAIFFEIWLLYIYFLSDLGKESETAYLLGVIPLILTDLIIGICCMIYLIVKFKALHRMIMAASFQTDGENQEENNKKEAVIQYTIKKLTILASIQILTTDIIFILLNIVHFFNNLFVFDIWINAICLMLTFNFYDRYYKIFCCQKASKPMIHIASNSSSDETFNDRNTVEMV